jgi:hypothetical protein
MSHESQNVLEDNTNLWDAEIRYEIHANRKVRNTSEVNTSDSIRLTVCSKAMFVIK